VYALTTTARLEISARTPPVPPTAVIEVPFVAAFDADCATTPPHNRNLFLPLFMV
jgi:hypothetical protein